MTRRRRRWDRVNEKMRQENACRACGGPISACVRAHVIGRAYDSYADTQVNPLDVIPLCSPLSPNRCHQRYDDHELDIADHLTAAEIARAVELVGPGRAARRIRGSRDPAPLPHA